MSSSSSSTPAPPPPSAPQHPQEPPAPPRLSVPLSSSSPPASPPEEEEETCRHDHHHEGGILDCAVRQQQIEALVEKRTMNLDYLRRVFKPSSSGGGAFWLHSVLLSKDRLANYINTGVPEGRCLQFFHLGISLAKLMERHQPPPPPPSSSSSSSPPAVAGGGDRGAALIRDLAQLFEEYEYHHASPSAMQSVKLMLARQSDYLYPELNTNPTMYHPPPPSSSPVGGSSSPPPPIINPRLYRFGSEAVYEHLHPVSVPFPLDYVQVLDSLCHTLSLLYSTRILALLHPHHHDSSTDMMTTMVMHPNIFDALVKVDAKVKQHVIDPLSKELTDTATKAAKAELDWLRQQHDPLLLA